MRNLLKIVVVCLLLGLGMENTIYSQSNNDKATEQKAMQFYQQKNYSEALPLFSQLLSLYPQDDRYNLYYAACLIETNQLIEKAVKYLQFADSKSSDPFIKYYLGRAYHLNYQFKEAIDNYELFKQKASAKQIKELNIDKLIDMCKNGLNLIKYISDLTVVDNRRIKSENYFYSYDLKEFDGKLVIKPKELKSPVDKKEEPANTVIFLPNNSNIIYYGSYGTNKNNGRDIYRIERLTDGNWSKPENLGPIINTNFDEDYPFLFSDGKTLYFSSKGHNSMGGYDIFKSEFDSTSMKWSTPVNMDFPVNTPYDDYLYITDKDNFYAFFTSNRETRDNNITVYKIIVDKNPVKREFKDLEEIIKVSRLDVSSIAEIKKAENSKQKLNVKEQNVVFATNESNANSTLNISPYVFKPLTYNSSITSQEVANNLKADNEKIQKNADEIKRQSQLAYIIAKDKNSAANQKRKEAYEKNASIKSITDPVEAEQEKQQVYQLINEAEEMERQAITAYNIAQNFEQIASEMEKDISKSQIFITAVEKQGTVDEAIIDAANKNKERLELSQNKYSSLQKEFENRKNIQTNKENELSAYEQMFNATTDSMNQLDDKIKDLENKQSNSNSETEKNFISTQLDELNKQSDILEAKQVEIAELIEKTKTDIENINSENVFIKQLAETVSNDKRTKDELSKVPIEKTQLKTDIFEKELSADIAVAQTVKEKVGQKTTNKTNNNSNKSTNNTLAQNTPKTSEGKNENITVQPVDTANVANQNNNDQLPQNTINGINPLLPASTQTNTPTAENLEKEQFNQQYYSSIVREQKQKLDIINNAINKSRNKKEKELLEQQKSIIIEEIQTNQKALDQSQQKINEYKKTLANQIDTAISRSDEELVLKASKYDNKYEINYSLVQKKQLEDANQSKQDIASLNDQIKKTIDELNQLETLKSSTINSTEKKNLQNDIDNKTVQLNQLFKDYSSKIDNSNQNQLNVYNQVLSTVRNYNLENPEVKTANFLEKEIEALKDKSNQLKKQAIVVNDHKEKFDLYKKADIIEQIAIQKQKYAIDLYVSSRQAVAQVDTVKSNNDIPSETTNNHANKQNNHVKNISVEITPEESNVINQYQSDKNKAEIKLAQGNSIFKEVQEKRNLADKTYAAAKKKEILKDVDKKEQQSIALINEAHQIFAKADSEKYNVYRNKLDNLIRESSVVEENKTIASQFIKEADFYYNEAQQVRAISKAAATNNDKVELLNKALALEQKALINQEYALDALTNNEPVEFVATNNLTKIDRLEALDKPVNVDDVIRIKTERILSNLNLSEEEKTKLDEAQAKQLTINQLTTEAEKYEAKLTLAKEIAQKSPNKSEKKKAEKSIPKIEKEYFSRKFTAAELSENVNDNYYNLYQTKFIDIRPKDKSTEAKQGKQLEKDANKMYIQAKQLREKSFITENPYQAYNYLLKADSIEKLAIEQQEKAFGLYLKLKPLDEEIKEYAEKHPKKQSIDELIVIKTPANITPMSSEELAQMEQDNAHKVKSTQIENNQNNENVTQNNVNENKTEQNNQNNENQTTQNNVNENKTEQNNNQNNVTEQQNNNQANQNNENVTQNNVNENNTEQNNNQNNVTEQQNNNQANQNNENVTQNNVNENKTEQNNQNNENQTEQNNVNKNTNVQQNNQNNEEDNLKNQNPEQDNNANTADNSNKNVNKNENVENNQAQNAIPTNISVPMGFSFMPSSPYSDANPIPINQPLPEGLVFKVQIGAFNTPVKADVFTGLSPVSAEKLQGSKYYRYFVGMFYSEAAAIMVRNYIRPMGYKDAFVVPFYNGKRITLFEARKLIKQSSSPEYDKIIADESEKIKNVTSVSPFVAQRNEATNNQVTENIANQTVSGSVVNNTKELFYTVQIGVFKKPVSHEALKNLEPLYEDHAYGFIRYLVGKYSSRKDADVEKAKVVALGIKDAFVSAYYNGQKITLNEAANVEAMNPGAVTKSSDKVSSNYTPQTNKDNNIAPVTDVDVQNLYFRVQIGSFKEKVPFEIAAKFVQISGQYAVDQTTEGESTVYYAGKFKSYDEALNCKTIVSKQGFPDAFVVATDGKKRVPVNQAKSLLNQ